MRLHLVACAFLGLGSAGARAARTTDPLLDPEALSKLTKMKATSDRISLEIPRDSHVVAPVSEPNNAEPAPNPSVVSSPSSSEEMSAPIDENPALVKELNLQLAARLAKLLACPRNARKLSAADRKWENVRYMKHAFNDWKNAVEENKLPSAKFNLAEDIAKILQDKYGLSTQGSLKSWLSNFDNNFEGVSAQVLKNTDKTLLLAKLWPGILTPFKLGSNSGMIS